MNYTPTPIRIRSLLAGSSRTQLQTAYDAIDETLRTGVRSVNLPNLSGELNHDLLLTYRIDYEYALQAYDAAADPDTRQLATPGPIASTINFGSRRIEM